jgi:hypothetical protein
MVQNGSAAVPGPVLLQAESPMYTYRIDAGVLLDDCVLAVASVAGAAVRPTARSDAVIPASQTELRT